VTPFDKTMAGCAMETDEAVTDEICATVHPV
jgi:hypothetical protein